jgi:hypothetical protein
MRIENKRCMYGNNDDDDDEGEMRPFSLQL